MTSKKKISKVIVPVAGLGTRLLPATKAIPKEMLPIIDKPIIQYVFEEIIDAGFKEIILITHSSKNSIENHFDKSFELENTLEKRVKRSLLKEIKSISSLNISYTSIRQSEARGLGHAILQAKKVINNEPFAVVLPDRVMNKKTFNPRKDNLSQMKKDFEMHQKNIILLERVNKKDVDKYGIAKLSRKKIKNNNILEDIIEKPSPKKAPSNFAVVGRYIFQPIIFDYIKQPKDKRKEIELTDAIREMINQNEIVVSSDLVGECFDCGSKEGYFRSILKTGMHKAEYRKEAMKILKEL